MRRRRVTVEIFRSDVDHAGSKGFQEKGDPMTTELDDLRRALGCHRVQ